MTISLINDMPDEILVQILDYLDDKTLVKIQIVSTKMRNLCNGVFNKRLADNPLDKYILSTFATDKNLDLLRELVEIGSKNLRDNSVHVDNRIVLINSKGENNQNSPDRPWLTLHITYVNMPQEPTAHCIDDIVKRINNDTDFSVTVNNSTNTPKAMKIGYKIIKESHSIRLAWINNTVTLSDAVLKRRIEEALPNHMFQNEDIDLLRNAPTLNVSDKLFIAKLLFITEKVITRASTSKQLQIRTRNTIQRLFFNFLAWVKN